MKPPYPLHGRAKVVADRPCRQHEDERPKCPNCYSSVRTHPSILTDMMCCAYCGQPATMRIASHPERVCLEHALEFWTGLLAYARGSSDPCVTHEPLCTCESCNKLSASYLRTVAVATAAEESRASFRRAMAIAAAGPSPGERERFPTQHAS
jgi:hypothetical protein